MSEVPPIHGCAICGRVLDWHSGTGQHQHALIDEPADHPPVPVPIEEIPAQLQPRCDFCLDGPPTYTLPVRSFMLPDVADYASEGNWAACDECAELLDKNAWNALLHRAKASNESRHGPMSAFMEQRMRQLYRAVRKNVSGGLRKDM